MKILILNWKDIKHSQSGGAEFATQALAENLVKLNYQVTIFTSYEKQLKIFEKIHGVIIYRTGNFFTVYWHAFKFYKKNQNKFDIVIDQIHGIPFFTPFYVKQPILAYIHEIADQIWFKEFPLPIALFGIILEKLFLKIYQQIPFLTDTKSTALELEKNQIPKNNIFILPLTINIQKLFNIPKSKNPTIIYIGRITPMKQIDILIKSIEIAIIKIPNLQLLIAGKSKKTYYNYLLKLASKDNLKKHVKFIGEISNSEKFKLYKKSWLQIHPSIKEGFGLTILEAATQKTPTIGFDVPGIRDNIKNWVNGIIVKSQTPKDLAKNIIMLVNNNKKLHSLQETTYNWSKKLPTYSTQSKKLDKILNNLIK